MRRLSTRRIKAGASCNAQVEDESGTGQERSDGEDDETIRASATRSRQPRGRRTADDSASHRTKSASTLRSRREGSSGRLSVALPKTLTTLSAWSKSGPSVLILCSTSLSRASPMACSDGIR